MACSGWPSRATILSPFLQSSPGSGSVGFHLIDDYRLFRKPPRRTYFRRGDGQRDDGLLEDLISALNAHGKRLIRTEPHPGLQLFPGGVLDVIDLHDPVARLQAGSGRRGVMLHTFDHRRLVAKNRILVMHHVHGGKQEDGQQNIHRRAGNRNQEAVPPRVGHELGRIAGALVHGILAAHLHVAAQRDGVDAIVGVALAEADQPLAESNGELLHPDPQQLGHGIVAELVDQNHEAQNHSHGSNSDKEIRHKRSTEQLPY